MDTELIYLYQAEWCPYCHNVRSKLTDLEIDYLTINVPRSKADRDELFQVSGQRGIPTLVHGDLIISDDDEAINVYLDEYTARENNEAAKQTETVGV